MAVMKANMNRDAILENGHHDRKETHDQNLLEILCRSDETEVKHFPFILPLVSFDLATTIVDSLPFPGFT
jgi:hypothetical protein